MPRLPALIASLLLVAGPAPAQEKSCQERIEAARKILDSGREADDLSSRLTRLSPPPPVGEKAPDSFGEPEFPVVGERSWTPEEILSAWERADRQLSAPDVDPKKLSKDTTFLTAAALQDLFAEAVHSCDMDRKLGLDCDRTIPIERLRKIFERPPPAGEFGDNNLRNWSPLFNVSDLLLWRMPEIRVDVRDDTNPPRAVLYLPFRPGKGFKSEEEWREIFRKIQSAGERFWRGTYASREDGEIEIRLRIVETRGGDGITVDLPAYLPRDAGVSPTEKKLKLQRALFRRKSGDPDMALAHEIGHLLGFQDHYRYFIDFKECRIGQNFSADDIMTCHSDARITRRELDLLYRAYVQEPSENDNELIDKISAWEKPKN